MLFAKLIGALGYWLSSGDSFNLNFALYTFPFPSAINKPVSSSTFRASRNLCDDKIAIWCHPFAKTTPEPFAVLPFDYIEGKI